MSKLNISVNYLGMELRSPIVPSASPLSDRIESIKEMEDCGAGAVVLTTLFEEPFNRSPLNPNHYFERIARAKKAVKIPIIASLSARTPEGWAHMAQRIEEAGADALELNIYHLNLSPDVPSSRVEDLYLESVERVNDSVTIPFVVKLPPYFTNLSYVTKQMRRKGAGGFVLFNRFYQPDVDLLSMGPSYTLRLSTSSENRLTLRWISLLCQRDLGYLAATTGIRTGCHVLKMVLSGACITQVCSVLLQRGIPWIQEIERDLLHWMEICKISSLRQSIGVLSHQCLSNSEQIEREEYIKALQGYDQIEVPSWKDEVSVQ